MSYQEDIKYYPEMMELALRLKNTSLNVDDIVTRHQRRKFSQIDEWYWMKYKGVEPGISRAGEIVATGRCRAPVEYKHKECYLFTDDLYIDEENKHKPMCFCCHNNYQEDLNF